MESLISTRSKLRLPPSSDLGLFVPWSVEYLFDVITKEGEKKNIKKLSLDPKRLDIYVTGYQVRKALSPLEKTIESKNPLFQNYFSWLKEKYGTDPQYKEDLEMLENAAAIIVTATCGKIIWEGLPYSDIHFATRRIRALRRGDIIE